MPPRIAQEMRDWTPVPGRRVAETARSRDADRGSFCDVWRVYFVARAGGFVTDGFEGGGVALWNRASTARVIARSEMVGAAPCGTAFDLD